MPLISALVRSPGTPVADIAPLLPALALALQSVDVEVVFAAAEVCAYFHGFDDPDADDRCNAYIEAGIVERIVNLLGHSREDIVVRSAGVLEAFEWMCSVKVVQQCTLLTPLILAAIFTQRLSLVVNRLLY